MQDPTEIIRQIVSGDIKSLARAISMVENEAAGYAGLLRELPARQQKIIGVTGAPGAGKSTLVDAMIAALIAQHKKVGVLCVDPSSAFHYGALLGDRIRMGEWFRHPDVYIRSLATRGSLGGLTPKIIEITSLLQAAPFDEIIIETVGVGQSEIEIAGLADTTLVVLVPQAGDEIQVMKSGIMEIGDIFVVNKADKPGADQLVQHLYAMLEPVLRKTPDRVKVVKTSALEKTGIDQLMQMVADKEVSGNPEKKIRLLAEKAFQLIQQNRMKDLSRIELAEQLRAEFSRKDFNIYRFAEKFKTPERSAPEEDSF